MRAAPPFQVSLRRFGLWRGAVCAAAASGAVVIAAWAETVRREGDVFAVSVAVLLMSTGVAIASSLIRFSPLDLRWDGRVWHLSAPGSSFDACAGDLAVTIDLGFWMLLRFDPASASSRFTKPVWLPVQRPGLESSWHSLRCALYGPRPAAGTESSAEL